MGRGRSRAGKTGGLKGQKATNARQIDKMNEAQLDAEIKKTEKRIDQLQKTMDKNNIAASEDAKAMQEAFPLGAGGDGWSQARTKARDRVLERDAKKAKAFADAYSQKQTEEKRLTNLKKAKRTVRGTGKTVEQIQKEATKKAVSETPKSLKWTTTQKGGRSSDGGYAPKIIKSGVWEIHGSGGLYSVYKNGTLVGRTNKLSNAKAAVERLNKR